jgi:hypothetical protein
MKKAKWTYMSKFYFHTMINIEENLFLIEREVFDIQEAKEDPIRGTEWRLTDFGKCCARCIGMVIFEKVLVSVAVPKSLNVIAETFKIV